MPRVVLLPGDGIGPEILAVAVDVLRAVADDVDVRGAPRSAAPRSTRHGTALTDEVARRLPRGGRRPARRRRRPEVGHDRPRRAAARAGPARPAPGARPLRQPAPGQADRRRCWTPARCAASVIDGTDLLVVRELTGGIYFGEKTRTETSASDDCALHRAARSSGSPASPSAPPASKVTSVDKANVLETSRLWREVVRDVHAARVPARRARARARRQRRRCSSSPPRATSTSSSPRTSSATSSATRRRCITGSIGMLPSASLGDGPTAPGPVRARPRLGAGHRGAGDRQPAGDVPVGRDAPPARPRSNARPRRP